MDINCKITGKVSCELEINNDYMFVNIPISDENEAKKVADELVKAIELLATLYKWRGIEVVTQ